MTVSKQKGRYIKIIVLFLGAVILLIGFNYNFNVYDEGVGLLGAERVSRGDIPYRDFWTLYSPGIFYLNALISSIFGWSIITGRIITVVLIYLIAYVTFILSRKITTEKTALIPFAITIIFFSAMPQNSRAIVPALLMFFIGTLCFINFAKSYQNKWLTYSGISNGFVFLFRYDLGIYLLLSSILILIILKITKKSNNLENLNFSIIGPLLILTSSFLIITIPVAIYFMINVPAKDLYEQLYLVPVQIFSAYRSIPFPVPFRSNNTAIAEMGACRLIQNLWTCFCFYLPMFVYLSTIIYPLKKWNKEDNFLLNSLIFLSVAGLFLYGQASVRSDVEHAIPTIIMSSIVMSIFYNKYKNRKTLIYLILVFTMLVSVPLMKKTQNTFKAFSHQTRILNIKRAAGITSASNWNDENEKAVAYIMKNTGKDEKIFVGCSSHDKILLNYVIFYFLCERQSCTKYQELHPGVATTTEVQKEIINEIKLNSVRYIVLVNEEFVSEPNMSRISSNVFLLDNYIRENYILVFKYGRYLIFKRQI